jgi:hypothetical protein
MKRTNNLIAAIVIGILVPSIFGQNDQDVKSDSLREILIEHRVVKSDLEHRTVTNAFSGSLSRAKVPGGIVTVSSCPGEEVKHTYPGLPSPLTLREALDAIVVADPRYRWQVEDGIINLMPVRGEPELLDTRIAEFYLENAVSVLAALSRLLELPEVRQRRIELGLKSGLQFGGLQSPNPRRLTVHLQDVTLREALNAIARAHGYGVWSYTEFHCNGRNEFSIEFLVR